MLGFAGFGTSKGRRMEDNHSGAAKGAVAKVRRRRYRQYLNRKSDYNPKLADDPVYRRKDKKE
jgi:hypothetical protein